MPDRTLLLRIDPHAGRARQAGRGEAPDRLEREGEAFFARDRAGLRGARRGRAGADPRRSTPRSAPDAVLADAIGAISDLLPEPAAAASLRADAPAPLLATCSVLLALAARHGALAQTPARTARSRQVVEPKAGEAIPQPRRPRRQSGAPDPTRP